MGPFHGGPYAPVVYQADPVDAHLSMSNKPLSQGPLPVIAPKPPMLDFSAPTSYHHGQIYQGQQIAAPSAPLDLSSPSYGQPNYPSSLPLFPQPQRPSIAAQQHVGYRQSGASDDSLPSVPMFGDPDAGNEPPSFPGPPRPSHPNRTSAGPSRRGHMQPPPGIVLSEEEEFWFSDDDASMVESDDDDAQAESFAGHLESNDLGIIVARRLDRPVDMFNTQPRTFSNFADENVLASYFPSSTNSPLNDTQTAAIFWYFVNVTAPSMSLYERHPFDPSPMFQGQPVPKARQHIWTCEFIVLLAARFSLEKKDQKATTD